MPNHTIVRATVELEVTNPDGPGGRVAREPFDGPSPLRDALTEALSYCDSMYPNVRVKDITVEREHPYTKWPYEDPAIFWYQSQYWTDARGTRHRIDEMDPGYISNVLYMLRNEAYKVRGDMTSSAVWDSALATALRLRMLAIMRGEVQFPVPDNAYA